MTAQSSEIITFISTPSKVFLRIEKKDGRVDNFPCLWTPEPLAIAPSDCLPYTNVLDS